MHRFYMVFMKIVLLVFLVTGLTGCKEREEAFVLSDTEVSVIEDERAAYIEEEAKEAVPPESSATSTEVLYVFVCGQVQNPGVYCLEPGSRVVDVIRMAGGCLETADICVVNQAERLTDGSRIYIPALGEAQESGLTEDTGSDGLVHLNQAGKEELMTLPGIGASKAEQILEYRETQGGFTKIDDIMNIPGIKEGVFRKIQDYITVE